jgi:nucleoside phosphorylase
MELIGLIAAMPQESAALLRIVKNWKRVTLGPLRGGRFHLLERECLLVTSGMGQSRAMQAARALLAAINPQILVSFGIAGAVEDDLRIGDVVIAGNSYLLEGGATCQHQPLGSLTTPAWEAAEKAVMSEGGRLFAGTAITTRGSQVIMDAIETMPHPILEMETAGIAQVAAEKGIALISIRAISDGPQSPIPFDLESMLDEKYNFRVTKMLWVALRHPRIILQSRRMMKNSRIAADQAAKALVAVLNQPLPILS